MINKKYLLQVQTLLLSGIMSFIMSGVITLINLGLVEGFGVIWFHAWVLAYAIAFPTIMVVFPFARKMATRIASKEVE